MWVVVVEGRAFVRSWNDKPTGFIEIEWVKLSALPVQPMPESVGYERVMDLVDVGQGFKKALSLRYIPG